MSKHPKKPKPPIPPIIRWLATRGLVVVPAPRCGSPEADTIARAVEDGTVTYEGSHRKGHYSAITVLRTTTPLPAVLAALVAREHPYLRRSRTMARFLRQQYRSYPKVGSEVAR